MSVQDKVIQYSNPKWR